MPNANEVWTIANWEEGFEVAQSRRRAGRLSWVPVPTRHDSRGYRRLIRGVNGVQHFAAWIVLVQIAARMNIRGILADDRGIALTSTDLEAMSDIPSGVFDSAFVALVDIGWITRRTLVREQSDHAPSEVPLQYSTEQNKTKTEQDKTQQGGSSLELRVLKNSSQPVALALWARIPENRRKGKGKWLENYAHIVEREQIDPEVVIDAVLRYYESPDGQSRYHREAGTLIFDRIWEDEGEQVWDRKNSTTIDGSDALDVFDRVTTKKDKTP